MRFPLFLLAAASLFAQAPLPHHVVISVPSAEEAIRLHGVFTRDLGLPATWPVAKYGTRTSGGVFLGNFTLELAVWPQVDPNQLLGLAIAVTDTTDIAAKGLTLREQPAAQGQMEYWRNTSIAQLAGEGLGIFLCRYNPAWLGPLEQKARAAFHGGPAGISGVVSVNLTAGGPRREALIKLFEPATLDSLSPALTLVEGQRFQLRSVTVRAKDPDKAKSLLPEGFPVTFIP